MRPLALLALVLMAVTTSTVKAQEASPIASPIPEGATTLVGDAAALLPSGDPDKVAVVAIGDPVGGIVPIAIRNTTTGDVLLGDLRGTAKDQDGQVVKTSLSVTWAPLILRSGQLAIGTVYFGNADLPPGLTYEFEPMLFPVETKAYSRDIAITALNWTPEQVTGTLTNTTEVELSSSITVIGLCVDQTGTIRGYYWDIADTDSLDPGESVEFSAALYGTGPCDSFVIGATGTSFPPS